MSIDTTIAEPAINPPDTGDSEAERPLFGRWLGLAGIVYAIGFFGGHISHSGAGGDYAVTAYADYIADDDRMVGAAIQGPLTVIGVSALIIFAVGFVQRHRHVRPALAALATSAAVAYGVLWTVGTALITAAGQAAKLQASVALSPEVAQGFDIAGSYLLYWAGLSVAGVWVLASVRLADRSGASGTWLTRFGYVAGVALLPGFIWIGFPLHTLWVLIISVRTLLGRSS